MDILIELTILINSWNCRRLGEAQHSVTTELSFPVCVRITTYEYKISDDVLIITDTFIS